MRDLKRNLQPVFYKLLEGQQEIVDQYGNATGSFIPIYGELKSAMLCVSPNKGSSEVEQFGSLADYDRTMTTSDIDCEIDEDSVLWIDDADTDGPWNYKVNLRAPWKNSVQYAIKQVTVSQYDAQQRAIQEAMQRAGAVNEENQSEIE